MIKVILKNSKGEKMTFAEYATAYEAFSMLCTLALVLDGRDGVKIEADPSLSVTHTGAIKPLQNPSEKNAMLRLSNCITSHWCEFFIIAE